ncbi:MAG: pyridoxamine 5'-phosphate oxidase family protein [Bacteroidota bacterium]
MQNYADLLFVDDVRALQDLDGTGEKYAAVYPSRTAEALDDATLEFIERRESFYIASVSPSGWPYVQHRGGPKGFLKATGKNQLGFADYRGNRQYVTMGHAVKNDRVALILMDYEYRTRLKILGHLKMVKLEDADPAVVERLETPGEGRVERIATIDVVAIDWNCPQYIPQLVSTDKVKLYVDAQLKDIAAENERLKAELALLKS